MKIKGYVKGLVTAPYLRQISMFEVSNVHDPATTLSHERIKGAMFTG